MTLFEMAIDEMAYEAKVDPLEFRRINYSAIDAMNRRALHQQGAARGV